MSEVSRDYWLGRWERGETGWHQKAPEPALTRAFAALAPTRVLVPLCGKSLDLAWLASRGHEVVGVEWSELACRQFFDEQRIPYQTSTMREFKVFSGGGVTLFNGDFFDLRPSDLESVSAIYDRAALIAQPPDLRARYAAHLKELARSLADRKSFTMLLIVLERNPPDGKGPPYSVSEQELRQLYEPDLKVSPLGRESVELGGSSGDHADECVYTLKFR